MRYFSNLALVNKQYKNQTFTSCAELVLARSDGHRRQAAGRGSGHNRTAAARQYKSVDADGRQSGNCHQHRQLVQARQPGHETFRAEKQQL